MLILDAKWCSYSIKLEKDNFSVCKFVDTCVMDYSAAASWQVEGTEALATSARQSAAYMSQFRWIFIDYIHGYGFCLDACFLHFIFDIYMLV
ncbi:hypothetical protein L1987_58252 [Smallanthus sonchifolius]|uniref:Uncharacterized protein n=1 Tax=Smallanthus sonchifolius TaxID=185202 RepID=A0ACB9DER8_9ASTR|nr:hypothetical protein L1987_58252 [Smallanthus sonchifolius]